LAGVGGVRGAEGGALVPEIVLPKSVIRSDKLKLIVPVPTVLTEFPDASDVVVGGRIVVAAVVVAAVVVAVVPAAVPAVVPAVVVAAVVGGAAVPDVFIHIPAPPAKVHPVGHVGVEPLLHSIVIGLNVVPVGQIGSASFDVL
jgi:hypothetical protein